MIVTDLSHELIPRVQQLMGLGEPYIRVRTSSDYWLYARLFSSTCPVALVGDEVAGAVIAFRSQDDPRDVYIQDVITHPDHRKQGVARTLLAAIHHRAAAWGCSRLYLTSEPDNTTADATWTSLGFTNVPGDVLVHGVSVKRDFKGPGKDRAVYQLDLAPPLSRR
ncbi:GNAT family N-acetyltransferase [Frankia sp. Cr1]|uniref:GNAT family N-acetyltransferase n=1 Tax=Frankia sp. Cr1 TaxID=3073931 RepID=UPI002AD4B2CD|nr:GNAT family N-acetyltransferase [Frankia sp. Cr1]